MIAVEWLYISTKETKGVKDCRKGRMNRREEEKEKGTVS